MIFTYLTRYTLPELVPSETSNDAFEAIRLMLHSTDEFIRDEAKEILEYHGKLKVV